MPSRIPDIREVSEALGYNPEETGFRYFGNSGFASYRTEQAKDLHRMDIGDEWSITTVRELVQFRIAALEKSLDVNEIELRSLGSGQKLKERVREESSSIISKLGPVWTKRFNTATATVKKGEEVVVVDIDKEIFQDASFFDYSKLVDGGAQFRDIEEMGNIYSRIPLSVYMAAKGGNRSILELYERPVVIALIPDEAERNKYLSALGILDLQDNFELGSQSIWVPAGFADNGGRFYSLGRKADSLYPPNNTTKYMELLLYDKAYLSGMT